MVSTKCVQDESSVRWVSMTVPVESGLPGTWRKLVCVKDNKPMTLAKYKDPDGTMYRNLQAAKEAFDRLKALETFEDQVPGVVVNKRGKRKSLPLNIEETSPSKRPVPSLGPRIQGRPLPQQISKDRSPLPVSKLQQYSPTSLQSCTVCNIAYDSKHSLEVHMKNQHGASLSKTVAGRMVQCDVCRKSYQSEEFLKKHKKEEHSNLPSRSSGSGSKNFSCDLCNLAFNSNKELKKHGQMLHVNNMVNNGGSSPAMFGSLPQQVNIRANPPPGPSASDRRVVNNLSRTGSALHDIFSCDECGVEFSNKILLQNHMKDMHDSPVKLGRHVQTTDVEQHDGILENNHYEDMEDLEFEDEADFEQEQASYDYQTGIDEEEDTEDGYMNDDEMEDDSEYLDQENDQVWNDDDGLDDEEHPEEEYGEESEGDYYDDDENEAGNDDIEIISNGVEKLNSAKDDIEVVEEKLLGRSNVTIRREPPMVKNRSLNSVQTRYSQITITSTPRGDLCADISPDEDDESEDEDTVLPPGPEEITLDDEPDEITLDEGDDETGDIVEVNDLVQEKEQLEKFQNYMKMLDNTEFVEAIIEDPDKLASFRKIAWYAQPSTWKPAKLGEVWHATVPQICSHYKLKDYPVEPDWWFASWDKFDEFFTAVLDNINPEKPQSSLMKLKKAKWFMYLHPVISAEMSFPEETLEDDED